MEYSILYPKKITTYDTKKTIKRKFNLVNHPDNPNKDGFEYYSYMDTVFGNVKTDIFIGFKNDRLHLINVRYFGSETELVRLQAFYDSCFLFKSERDEIFKKYWRTNPNFSESAQILIKSKDGVLGYYYFEINP